MTKNADGTPAMRKGWSRQFAVVLWAFVLLVSLPAAAQSNPDELARRHFEAATAYFEQADYESALREFSRAYDLSKRPEILLNLATVNERLGNWQAAVDNLDTYLTQAPDSSGAETVKIRRDNLQKRADKAAEEQTAQAPEDAAPASEPEEKPAEPKPPATTSTAMSTEDLGPTAGSSRLPAYIAFGVGGAALIGSVVTGIMAQSEHTSLEESCAPYCTDDEVSKGETLAITSTVLTGVAVLGAAVGAYFWFNTDTGDDEARTLPQVQVSLLPGSAAAAARWQF